MNLRASIRCENTGAGGLELGNLDLHLIAWFSAFDMDPALREMQEPTMSRRLAMSPGAAQMHIELIDEGFGNLDQRDRAMQPAIVPPVSLLAWEHCPHGACCPPPPPQSFRPHGLPQSPRS